MHQLSLFDDAPLFKAPPPPAAIPEWQEPGAKYRTVMAMQAALYSKCQLANLWTAQETEDFYKAAKAAAVADERDTGSLAAITLMTAMDDALKDARSSLC